MTIIQGIAAALILMAGFTVSGLVGFGGNVLSMPVLSLMFSVKEIVPAFSVVAFVNGLIRLIRARNYVLIRRLIKALAVLLPGLGLGIVLYHTLPELALKRFFALFIIGLAIYNQWKKEGPVLAEGEADRSPWITVFYYAILFFAGFMQGAFVCGGPLIVAFCNHYFGYNKQNFFGMTWSLACPGSALVLVTNLSAGQFHSTSIVLALLGTLSLIGAFRISDWLQKKLSADRLSRCINIVLAICGVSTFVQTLM